MCPARPGLVGASSNGLGVPDTSITVKSQNTKMTAVLRHEVHFDHLCKIHSDCVLQTCINKSVTDGRIGRE